MKDFNFRYGNEICLLDATYRTTKYALPLFFLAVPTNCGYSVVAEFVVENETKESIKEVTFTCFPINKLFDALNEHVF